MSDGRLKTLKAADLTEIEAARKRYQHISTTIDDAVTNLQKIMYAGEEGLRGEWVGPLKKDAESIRNSLRKAAVRYRDVAIEIEKYVKPLQDAMDEVAAATGEEEEGNAQLTRANAMPDPQKGPDGTIPPEEQQKEDDKKRAQDEANSQITAAKNRLTGALDDLDLAGKSFGDAVNCNKYDDGLTDKINWRVMVVFQWISKVLGGIAMFLAAVAFAVPAAISVVIAGAVVTTGLLIADVVLLAGGEGSVLSVVLDALGLGFAGLSLAAGQITKLISSLSWIYKGLPSFFSSAFKFAGWAFNEEGALIPLIEIGAPSVGIVPKPGFFEVAKNWLTGLFGSATWRKWLADLGLGAWKNVGFLNSLPSLSGLISKGLGFVLTGWGTLNQLFNLIASLIIAGMLATKHESLKGA